MKPAVAEIAGRIRTLRKARHWKQPFLATLSGIEATRVRQIERGNGRPPKSDEIARLARSLSVAASWILTGKVVS